MRGYAEKLRYFVEWWDKVGPACGYTLDIVRMHDFERWLTQYRGRFGPLGYHTRRDALRRLRSALRWAQDIGLITGVDAAAWVPSASGEPAPKAALTLVDLQRLVGAAKSSSNPMRDYALLCVLAGTGIRRRECAMLNVEHVRIDDSGGVLEVWHGKRVSGRSGHRQVVFDLTVRDALLPWLYEVGYNIGPLWPSPSGRLAPQSVYRIVRRLAQSAGVTMSDPCHDLRRMFVTHWDRHNRSEQSRSLLRRQVGHASEAMTDLYSRTDLADVRGAYRSPLEGLV